MFTAEIWKKAVGYETFEVSNLGRVKNTRLGIIISKTIQNANK